MTKALPLELPHKTWFCPTCGHFMDDLLKQSLNVTVLCECKIRTSDEYLKDPQQYLILRTTMKNHE